MPRPGGGKRVRVVAGRRRATLEVYLAVHLSCVEVRPTLGDSLQILRQTSEGKGTT